MTDIAIVLPYLEMSINTLYVTWSEQSGPGGDRVHNARWQIEIGAQAALESQGEGSKGHGDSQEDTQETCLQSKALQPAARLV